MDEIQGKRATFTGQSIVFLRRDSGPWGVQSRDIEFTLGHRRGVFALHADLVPDSKLKQMLDAALSAQRSLNGLLVWEGSVVLGVLSGVKLVGAVRRANEVEIAVLVNQGLF